MVSCSKPTWKRILLKNERQSTSCVRSCLTYGNNIWPMKMQHKLTIDKTGVSIERQMCAFTLKKCKEKCKAQQTVGTEPVTLISFDT